MKENTQNPIVPVISGAVTHEMKMFLVAPQFTESNPFAAMENPMMHPII